MRELLKGYDEVKVSTFMAYVGALRTEKKDGKLKNSWAVNIKNEHYVYFFKKLAAEGLYIDGDIVTFQFRGKLIIALSYQAYKNKVLMVYPETIFDIGIVNKDDEFSFKKESGKIVYTHRINDPFGIQEIIGAYCVIKNKTGEHLELMNLEEIKKCRETAKTDYIWKKWTEEMIKKTIIKRGCKRMFKDVTANIDNMDNDNYDLDVVDDKREENLAMMFNEAIKEREDKADLLSKFKRLKGDERKTFLREVIAQIKKESEAK